MKTYEQFEHTADVGLRIFGNNLQELFTNGATALLDQITDVSKAAGAAQARSVIELEAKNFEELFLKWLRELLYRFDVHQEVYTDVRWLKLEETKLSAMINGFKFDPSTHEQRHEVKAITYHGYKLNQKDRQWIAEIIVDI